MYSLAGQIYLLHSQLPSIPRLNADHAHYLKHHTCRWQLIGRPKWILIRYVAAMSQSDILSIVSNRLVTEAFVRSHNY